MAMIDVFKRGKTACRAVIVVLILIFAVVGMATIWKEYGTKDYDKHLTEKVYVDAVVYQNVNLVFYRTDCPYCQAGKKAVVTAAQDSPYPTFYIDVQSEDGQLLVQKYHVEKAATILQIRDGEVEMFRYATKNKAGKFTINTTTIKEIFNESES